MFYYILRIVLTVITIMSGLLLYFKYAINNSRFKVAMAMIVSILIINTLWSIPINKILAKFDTFEEAFKYDHSDSEAIKVYSTEDYAYIFYTNNNGYGLNHYIKKNNKWIIDNIFYFTQNKIKNYNGYDVYINNIKEKNVSMICIVYSEIVSSDAVISDKIGSYFGKTSFYYAGNQTNFLSCVLIESEIDKDYWINIDNNQYYIFK